MKAISEFFELLEQIVEDGELTYKEIYEVGKWINANKAARTEWPVSEFYQLLKGIFADGKMERSEAVQVARLIQSVRREWARRKASQSAPTVYELAFDPTTPKIPSIPTRLSIPSESDDDVSYEVDFTGPTCDCPDFKAGRAKLPVGHISRCCKHIMEGYSRLRPEDGWPVWFDAFIEQGIRPNPKLQWAVVPVGNFYALVSSPMKGWGNVYIQDDSGNNQFGYNISEDRWSYDTAPQGASKLEAAIKKMRS
jgi:hypothetical protein